jgi:hypothetical protein
MTGKPAGTSNHQFERNPLRNALPVALGLTLVRSARLNVREEIGIASSRAQTTRCQESAGGLLAQGLATASEKNRGSQSLRTSAPALGASRCSRVLRPCPFVAESTRAPQKPRGDRDRLFWSAGDRDRLFWSAGDRDRLFWSVLRLPLPLRAFCSCSPSFPSRPSLLRTTIAQLLVFSTRTWLTTNHKYLVPKSKRCQQLPLPLPPSPFDVRRWVPRPAG